MGSVRLGSYVFSHRHVQYSYTLKLSDSEKVGRREGTTATADSTDNVIKAKQMSMHKQVTTRSVS